MNDSVSTQNTCCNSYRPNFTVGHVACRQELSADKAVAEAELQRTLGTLRYLKGLQAARARAVAAQGPSPSTPLLSGPGAGADVAPYLDDLHPYACALWKACQRALQAEDAGALVDG